VSELGDTFYSRVDSPATQSIRKKLSSVTPNSVTNDKLAGEPITTRETTASGNGAAIGGIKLSTAHGWIAARPSGTENVFKTYAESFVSQAHLASLQNDARAIVQSL
jgi:phosphoglucomutase